MSSARRGYAPLPNPTADADAERELEAAFGGADSDGESDDESTPLHLHTAAATAAPVASSSSSSSSRPEPSMSALPGAYDFERADYDRPPPGSPPGPSALALPNAIGNSNGVIGTTPAAPPAPGVLRRTLGALLPQHYAPLPTGPSRVIGGGLSNDGVFGNVVAKPVRGVAITEADGSMYVVPEDTQREQPPSYQTAQLDTVPPYYDVSVNALDPGADMVIDDLPTGSVLVFIFNCFISFFFQFVGFLMTYIMHTSHAAKFGSRAGLGITLIQYGLYSRQAARDVLEGADSDAARFAAGAWTAPGNATDVWGTEPTPEPLTPEAAARIAATRAWVAFVMIGLGWALLVFALHGFWRVKRWERSVRGAGAPALGLRARVSQFVDRLREHRERRARAQATGEEAVPMVVPEDTQAQETPSQRVERLLRQAYII